MARDPIDSRLRAALEASPESAERLRAAALRPTQRAGRTPRRAWLAASAVAIVLGVLGWKAWSAPARSTLERPPLILSNRGEVVRLSSPDGSSLRARSVEKQRTEGVHFLWIGTSKEPPKGETR